MGTSIAGVGTVSRVLKACRLDAGVITGTYCKVVTDTCETQWVILAGARLATVPNDSLSTSENYARAYENYQTALELCDSGHLRSHFTVPKGSESQCLTILQGTPSSRKHASRYLTTLADDQLVDVLGQLQLEGGGSGETDDWTPEEKAEYAHHVEEDRLDGSGIVYLLESDDKQYGDLVKIGMTRRSIQKRIAELSEEPAGLFSRCRGLFHIEVPNPQTIEKGLHYIFATSRKPISFSDGVAEEWFEMDWRRAKRVMEILTEDG